MKKIIDTKWFKASEILYSSTAKKLGIDNIPKDDEIIDNINYTLNRLNAIREGYGHPIIITSGYRCKDLNWAVGGVKDSKHQIGLAVDLKWDTVLLDYLLENCSFDKLIREKSGGSKWIHIQFGKDIENERRITFSIAK